MTFTVIVLPRAESDIALNAEWWAENRSLEQAIEWTIAIQAKIESLAESPARCRLARENAQFDREIRQLLVGIGNHLTHRVLFTIRDETVFVLTVRSNRQDEVASDDVDVP